jgi:hypothetical protein
MPSHPLPKRLALLGVPVLLTLHNAEEALFVPTALRAAAARLPASLAAVLPAPEAMYVALAVATIIPWLVWMLGAGRGDSRLGTRVLLLLQCVVLVNVGWHVTAAVALGGYASGLATALALNLPFSVYLLRRALRERWEARRTLGGLLALALLIHGPGVALLLWAVGVRLAVLTHGPCRREGPPEIQAGLSRACAGQDSAAPAHAQQTSPPDALVGGGLQFGPAQVSQVALSEAPSLCAQTVPAASSAGAVRNDSTQIASMSS